MSFFDKISKLFGKREGQKAGHSKPQAIGLPHRDKIKREYVNFSKIYRVGILTFLDKPESQTPIHNYKKKLEQLGYECEILLFVNNAEKDPQVYLQSFNLGDLDKNFIPNSPKTDRFMIRRFDLLINLYQEPCPQLIYLSQHSNARCRVAPFISHFESCADLLIPMEDDFEHEKFIHKINETLQLKPYVRKEI